MDARKVNVANVVRGVIVLDLSASPIHALNLDCLAVLDLPGEWYCVLGLVGAHVECWIFCTVRVPSIL